MSAAHSPLKALQCHFTWDLDASRSKLLRLKENLQDIGTEEGYSWLGHIYNLQGYIDHQLGSTHDARRSFSRAAEAFRQVRNTVSDEGPWLVVNYGNLAWLHHRLGEPAESQAYLSKVDALMVDYPSPSRGELHPEVYAEKAWTLMKLGADKKRQAVDCFQRAIRMQPDVVEWHSSHVLALVAASTQRNKELDAAILDKMKIAKDHDPENLYLAALYFEACAKKGKKVHNEVRELARRVLRKPVSSYSGIRPLLRLYGAYMSMDEAIDLAEEVLERHPEERYLKLCAAVCYKNRILLDKDNPLEQGMTSRAVALYSEVIALYPHSSMKGQIALASIYAETSREDEADRIYGELLEGDLDPEGAQMLYNNYAKHVHFHRKEIHKSIEYHMRAAAIPVQSPVRQNSLGILERIKERNRNRMCAEIQEFLENLQE